MIHHLGSSNYDYYKYEIVSNLQLPSNAYKVSVEYENEERTERSGRDPYYKFNTKSLILEVYNRAIVSEDIEEHIYITVTNILTNEKVTKDIKITYLYVPPEKVDWTDETKLISHPIVELMYDKYNYNSVTIDIKGRSLLKFVDGPEGYSTYQYYIKSSVPLSSNDYTLDIKIDDRIKDYITWDRVLDVLYVKNNVDIPDDNYKVELTLSSRYLKSNKIKVINIVKGGISVAITGPNDTDVIYVKNNYDDINIDLVGRSSIVPSKGEGYDVYYYIFKSSPPLSSSEYKLEYNIWNSPCDDSIIFREDSMALYVRKGIEYPDNCKVELGISNKYNKDIYTKEIIISNLNSYEILGGN